MQMMKQAQGIQKRLKDTQQELANLEITGEAANGAVKVICDGQGKFKSIKLTAEAIDPENPSAIDADTVEMLEDIISSAIKLFYSARCIVCLQKAKGTENFGGSCFVFLS